MTFIQYREEIIDKFIKLKKLYIFNFLVLLITVGWTIRNYFKISILDINFTVI